MWDYKVIAGRYSLDGAEVVVENPLGKGTLQRILDHYGAEGYELMSSHYDNINREVVVLLKRLKPGAAAPAPFAASAAPAAHHQAAPAAPAAAEAAPPARGGGRSRGGGGGGRRSKEELDRLYRD